MVIFILTLRRTLQQHRQNSHGLLAVLLRDGRFGFLVASAQFILINDDPVRIVLLRVC